MSDTKQKEELVRVLLSKGGPLYQYLNPDDTGGATFSRFKELINEAFGTNITYSELYDAKFAGWLFNAELSWEHAAAQAAEDLGMESRADEESDVPVFYFSL